MNIYDLPESDLVNVADPHILGRNDLENWDSQAVHRMTVVPHGYRMTLMKCQGRGCNSCRTALGSVECRCPVCGARFGTDNESGNPKYIECQQCGSMLRACTLATGRTVTGVSKLLPDFDRYDDII